MKSKEVKEDQLKNTYMDDHGTYTSSYDFSLTENLKTYLDDTKQYNATLIYISSSSARWVLDDGKVIDSIMYSFYLDDGSSLNDTIFKQWLCKTNECIKKFNNGSVNCSGKLSVSLNARVIFGWQEDYTDSDSDLLMINDIMED